MLLRGRCPTSLVCGGVSNEAIAMPRRLQLTRGGSGGALPRRRLQVFRRRIPAIFMHIAAILIGGVLALVICVPIVGIAVIAPLAGEVDFVIAQELEEGDEAPVLDRKSVV